MIIADEAHFLKAHDVSLLSLICLVSEKQDIGAFADKDEKTPTSVRNAHASKAEGTLQSFEDVATRCFQRLFRVCASLLQPEGDYLHRFQRSAYHGLLRCLKYS